MEKKRELKKVDVTFISLVKKGANQKVILWKAVESAENPPYEHIIPISKVDDEQHMVYGIVYSPGEVDSQGDHAVAEVVKQMAYDFMKKGQTQKIDKSHDYIPDDGFVAESWLTKENDTVFPNDPVGSWAVGIKVTNEETWQQVKKGEITGLSLAGMAVVEEVQKSVEANGSNPIFRFFENLIEGVRSIRKDFNEQMAAQDVLNKVYTLMDAIRAIANDESVTDKTGEILKSVDQFKAAIGAATQTQKGEVIDMTKEETQALIAESLKPVTDSINDLKKSIDEGVVKSAADLKKSVDDLSKRVETVEKATPGSQQAPVAKADDKPKTNWL